MAANVAPIFPLTPRVSWGATALATANTAKDGTGTVLLVWTAGTYGSLLDFMRVRAIGTNTATVLRVFINNGADPTVAANNVLFTEKTIDATTLSEVAELADFTISLGMGLPANYRIYVAIGTTVAAGLRVCVVGGDY